MNDKHGKITGIHIDEQNITIKYEDGYIYKQDSIEYAGSNYGVKYESFDDIYGPEVGGIYMGRDEETPISEKKLENYIYPNLNMLVVQVLATADPLSFSEKENESIYVDENVERHEQVNELLDTYRKMMNNEEVSEEKRQAFQSIIHIDLKNLNNVSLRRYNSARENIDGKLGKKEFKYAKEALMECAKNCSDAGIEDVTMPQEKKSILDRIKGIFSKPKKELPSPTVTEKYEQNDEAGKKSKSNKDFIDEIKVDENSIMIERNDNEVNQWKKQRENKEGQDVDEELR